LNVSKYYCGKKYDVSGLQEKEDLLGLLIVHRGGALFATTVNGVLNVIQKLESRVPGKHGQGGQSQGRMENIIEIEAQLFFDKVAKIANEIFLNKVQHLIIGFHGILNFAKNKKLDYRLHKLIRGEYHVGYTDEFGLKELIQKAEPDLTMYKFIKEKTQVDNFIKILSLEPNKVVYGIAKVQEMLDIYNIKKILMSNNFNPILIKGMHKYEIILIDSTPEYGRIFDNLTSGIAVIKKW